MRSYAVVLIPHRHSGVEPNRGRLVLAVQRDVPVWGRCSAGLPGRDGLVWLRSARRSSSSYSGLDSLARACV
jgi:hypothetical protein